MGPKAQKVELNESQMRLQKLCYDEGYKFGGDENVTGLDTAAGSDIERIIASNNPYRKSHSKSFMDKAWANGAWKGMADNIQKAKDEARKAAEEQIVKDQETLSSAV